MPIEVTWKPVARLELKNLQAIEDADERLFLRFYLRSNIERDQDIARERCKRWGIDYEEARAEARRRQEAWSH